jgi:uncharacterized protein YqeY
MEQIKAKQIAARKAGALQEREASLLTTLLGEAAMVGKNANRETTDQEVVAVVKKFVKNIDETITALSSRDQDASAFMVERRILEQFLPVQMTEQAIQNVAAQFTSMPEFMKFMKENYAGQYDGKVASTIAKAVFA